MEFDNKNESVNEYQLKRDTLIYTDFESRGNSIQKYFNSKAFVVYELARECFLRRDNEDMVEFNREYQKYSDLMQKCQQIKKSEFDQYFQIEYPILTYLSRSGYPYLFREDENSYDELFSLGSPSKIYSQIEIQRVLGLFENQELFINDDIANMPMIIPKGRMGVYNKTASVQIDFTKPKEEIIAWVEKIKDEFDSNPSIIQGLDEFAAIIPNRTPDRVKNIKLLKNHEIYKHKSPKSLSERLSDALFIYDCDKLGISSNYAIDQIDYYWRNIKNEFTDEFQRKTYYSYLKFAQRLIDKGEIIHFLAGVEVPLSTK